MIAYVVITRRSKNLGVYNNFGNLVWRGAYVSTCELEIDIVRRCFLQDLMPLVGWVPGNQLLMPQYQHLDQQIIQINLPLYVQAI